MSLTAYGVSGMLVAAVMASGADNVTSNVQSNVVNVVSGGGTVNSGVDLGDGNASSMVRGNGKITTRTVNVAGITRLALGGAFELEIKLGGDQEGVLRIATDENVQPLIVVEMKNGELSIASTGAFSVSRPVRVTLSCPVLSGLVLGGACKGRVNGLNGGNFTVSAGGGSELFLHGKSLDMLKVSLEGAAFLDAGGVSAGRALVEASGAARCVVRVVDELEVNAGGASEIIYKGTPKVLRKSLSGAASLDAKD